MIAVDASATVLLFCDPSVEPRAAAARTALADDPVWIVPEHWLVETVSALRGLDRAGKLPAAERAVRALAALTTITVPTLTLLPRIWQLRHRLSAYDAAYVAAAEVHGCVLVTADERLARSDAARCPVRVLGVGVAGERRLGGEDGPMEIAALVDALHDSARATPGVTSLVVFGSTTSGSAGRRDEWSDVDFNLFVAPSSAARLASTWEFLPFRDRLVLTAREYDAGGVALYDDGTLMEFGAGLPWTIRDPDREVLLDGGDLTFDPPAPLPAPADQVGLFLVKLMIGVGRVRRGERVSGNGHVRTYALTALCEALRQHLAPDAPRSPFDPLRRLEQALPALGARPGELLDQDVETCARGLFDLARESLAPLLPVAAWEVAARRMGWD